MGLSSSPCWYPLPSNKVGKLAGRLGQNYSLMPCPSLCLHIHRHSHATDMHSRTIDIDTYKLDITWLLGGTASHMGWWLSRVHRYATTATRPLWRVHSKLALVALRSHGNFWLFTRR